MKALLAPDESEDVITFDKSLKELRELGSQLHYVADYCSSAFLQTGEKKIAVENTREYICRAMVTVVDHLGNVSANLDIRLTSLDGFAEAELRIHSLKQKLRSCEDYASKLALTRTRWNPILPKFSSRYLITRTDRDNNESQDISPRDAKKGKSHVADKHVEFNTKDRETKDPSSAKNLTAKCAAIERKKMISSIVPVSDGLSKPSPKSHKPTFHFQGGIIIHHTNSTNKIDPGSARKLHPCVVMQSTKKLRENSPSRKSARGSDIKSLIRSFKEESRFRILDRSSNRL